MGNPDAGLRRDGRGPAEPARPDDDRGPPAPLYHATASDALRVDALGSPENERGDFLTCDNPVVVEAEGGLAGLDARVLWPISRTMAVFLSRAEDKWRKRPRIVRGGIASHANRLAAAHADRFVFSHERAEWLTKRWSP